MLNPWWEQVEGRLETELQALRNAGIEYSTRQEDLAAGRLVLDLRMDASALGGPVALDLVARFPESFPYFRPEVSTPALDLPHHQHPFEKNLCLLGRRSDDWLPEMTLAMLLTEQLEKVLRANDALSPEDLHEIEELQGEPISAYYRFELGSVCFVDGGWPLPEPSSGRARTSFRLRDNVLTAHVHTLSSGDGRLLQEARATPPLDQFTTVDVRWFRLSAAPRTSDANGMLRHVLAEHPAAGAFQFSNGLDFLLVAYPEELSYRQTGAGWALLAREPLKKKGAIRNPKVHLVRVARAGLTDMSARVREYPAMRNVCIALFGLGCVGAPIALDLARAGAKALWLIDHDIVDAGATARWPLGLSYVGRDKVDALADFISHNYPFTEIVRVKHRLGGLPPNEGVTELEMLRELLDRVDIVIDATAEYGVQYFLSDTALRQGIPYIGAHGTHGGYGGEVVRLQRGRTGCWMCLRWRRQDGSIPEPPSLQADWTQPAGCAARTFVGASFDLSEVSLEASRVAVELITGQELPAADVRVLNLRDSGGARTLPSWKAYSLPSHPSCSACAARE